MVRTLLLATLIGGTALAQATAPSVVARRLMAEGQFDQAMKSLDKALSTERETAELVQLQLLRGQCLLALGEVEPARVAFAAALKKDPSAALDASRASPDALDLLEKARAELPGVVSVAVNGTANVRIDGKALGPAPLTIELKPGQHVVEAASADGRTAKLELNVKPGKKAQLSLELKAAGQAPSAPRPEVCVDGQELGPDTAGHCCWAGQVWSDGRCLGVPTSCPKAFVLDKAGQRCAAPTCAEGMVRAADALHCCWPGQAWSASRSVCVGVPRCPAGWSAPLALRDGAERCLKDPVLLRTPVTDAECPEAKFPGRLVSWACDVPDYRLTSRADLTAEELDAIRGQYRVEEVAACKRAAAGRDCVLRGDPGAGTRLHFCCR